MDPNTLATMELFVGLGMDALNDVAALARVRPLAHDIRIFGQGEPATRVHALLEGGVRITQSGRDGGEAVMRFIGPGEMFGTVALFTDRLYPAEAVTLDDSVEISWSEADLHALIGRHPGIALNLLGIVGRRLAEAQDRIRELSTQRVERRIAHALLRLADQAGHDGGAGGTTIRFPLTRKDLAAVAGTTLHTASRVLTAWEKAGMVATERRHVTLRQPDALRAIAEEE
ncbi:MAG TPA: Crp/Fnr family transcriptional regulator [Sphingomonadaceae bacterium]|nr:Crp/Fnr family transcriptional regulator [Sphingomonadaceae bacterium]